MSTEVDITDAVEAARSTFVTWGVGLAYTELITLPYLTWLALPVISSITKWLMTQFLNYLSNQAVMQSFFLNTALRKAAQAQDFVSAVDALNNLPGTATDADYAKAEQDKISAFTSFVTLSS